ncbi:MAG: hypothetical protein RB148_11370 [Armatimonadota bacterium]|nr:hypothetical protein [Armatimonadota bacterium]
MRGTVVDLPIASSHLAGTRTVKVYVPAGAPGERYPAVYRLRGHEREWMNPAEDPSRQGRTAEVVATLAARGVQSRWVPFVLPGSQHNGFWADEHLQLALTAFAEAWAGPTRVSRGEELAGATPNP